MGDFSNNLLCNVRVQTQFLLTKDSYVPRFSVGNKTHTNRGTGLPYIGH